MKSASPRKPLWLLYSSRQRARLFCSRPVIISLHKAPSSHLCKACSSSPLRNILFLHLPKPRSNTYPGFVTLPRAMAFMPHPGYHPTYPHSLRMESLVPDSFSFMLVSVTRSFAFYFLQVGPLRDVCSLSRSLLLPLLISLSCI